MMKMIYIAGPYRGSNAWKIESNIFAARSMAARIVTECEGAAPVVPHANTAHFDGIASDDYFIAATLELLRRCDAVMLLPGWQSSSGTRGELAEAIIRHMPVFESVEELRVWLEVNR